MPTQRFRKKNKKTAKHQKEKRVWMYRKGNVVLCYNIPYLKIVSGFAGGADGTPSKEKAEAILDQLRTVLNPPEKTFLVNHKEQLLEKLLNDPSKKELLAKSTDILNEKNADSRKVLVDWVSQRKYASDILDYIKEEAKNKDQQLSSEEAANLEKVLNHENLKDIKGTLSSVSSSVFNGITKGATSLGQFLTSPPLDPNYQLQNETTVQLLWYPRSNENYRKGKSTVNPKTKYGDFMIYIQPERYANTITYFSDMANSVEDLFADSLNGCSDALCLKGQVPRLPYKKQVMTIVNKQPQFDLDEYAKTVLEPPKKNVP
jgi:hypothetical protein